MTVILLSLIGVSTGMMPTWFWISVISLCSLLQATESSIPYGDVRLSLSDGTTAHHSDKGRLEIYLHGQWGTICDDGFGSTEADVACRQLGFEGALYYGSRDVDLLWEVGFSSDESLPILLDDIWCEETDNALLDCSHAGIGNHNCAHHEDVQLVCLTDGSLRLVDYSETSYGFSREATTYGRLEIYLHGQWGTICSNSFDDTAGSIACKSLGFAGMYYNGIAVFIGQPSGSEGDPIWLDNVVCSSDDVSLLSCEHDPIGINNCSHWQDMGVMCYNSDHYDDWLGEAIIGIVLSVIFGIGGCLAAVIGFCVCMAIGFGCAKQRAASQRQPMVINAANQGTIAPAYPVQGYHPTHSVPTNQQQYPPPSYSQTQPGYSTQNTAPNLPQGPPPGYPNNQNIPSAPYPVQQYNNN